MSSLKPTNVTRTIVRARQQHGLMRFFQACIQGANVRGASVQGNSEMDKANPNSFQHCSVIQQGDCFVVTALSLI